MKCYFQKTILYAYKIAKSTGFLSTKIGRKISTNGYFLYKNLYEPNIEYLKSKVARDSTIIDVGANIGFLSLKFSNWVSPYGLVIAIEPEPTNVNTLKQMVFDKKITNIEVINGAAAEIEGVLFLEINSLNPADHRLSENGVSIKSFTIDGILNNIKHSSVSLIKIDVQGAEPRVLEGAKKTISQFHPMIFIEIDDEALLCAGFTAHELVNYLHSLGYELFDPKIQETRPFSENDHHSRKKIGYADYLFIFNH